MTETGNRRGADLVADALTAAGVKTVFSLSGNQIMPIYDALLDTPARIVHFRHENAAVFAAEAYAQATGEVGIALLTAGPGFANALSAMYSARMSETPVVVLTGDAPLSQTGAGAFQEMAQTAAATTMCKASYRVESTEMLGQQVTDAMRQASAGRPGPVHLALPFDLVTAEIATTAAVAPNASPDRNPYAAPSADDATVADILARLATAERPLIIAGPRFCRAHIADDISKLVRATDIPVVGMESPRGLRDPRLGAFAEVFGKADLVLSLGKSFDFTTNFGKPPATASDCTIVQIDADAAILDRDKAAVGDRLTLSVHADPLSVARQMTKAATAKTGAPGTWRQDVEAAVRYRPAQWAAMPAGDSALHPVTLSRGVADMLKQNPGATLVIDGGEVGQWFQACLEADVRIINGPSGAIGGSLPYAIGAKAARPDHPVFVLLGDGTAGFHFAEFETAVRTALPFIAIIGNDSYWNAEHQIQLNSFGPDRTFACDLTSARYDQAAAGLGAHGEYVTNAAELTPALERALASDLPSCLNVTLDGQPAPIVTRG